MLIFSVHSFFDGKLSLGCKFGGQNMHVLSESSCLDNEIPRINLSNWTHCAATNGQFQLLV